MVSLDSGTAQNTQPISTRFFNEDRDFLNNCLSKLSLLSGVIENISFSFVDLCSPLPMHAERISSRG